jgi:hypothetical protein
MPGQGVNDNQKRLDVPLPTYVTSDAPIWVSVAEREPPIDRELLMWVHGPFIGHWDGSQGVWVEKMSRAHLAPIRYWAYITAPYAISS